MPQGTGMADAAGRVTQGKGSPAQAQEQAECLEVSFDQKVASAPGLILGPSTLAPWSRPENVHSHKDNCASPGEAEHMSTFYRSLFVRPGCKADSQSPCATEQ